MTQETVSRGMSEPSVVCVNCVVVCPYLRHPTYMCYALQVWWWGPSTKIQRLIEGVDKHGKNIYSTTHVLVLVGLGVGGNCAFYRKVRKWLNNEDASTASMYSNQREGGSGGRAKVLVSARPLSCLYVAIAQAHGPIQDWLMWPVLARSPLSFLSGCPGCYPRPSPASSSLQTYGSLEGFMGVFQNGLSASRWRPA